MSDNPFRRLPPVSLILEAPALKSLQDRFSSSSITDAVRHELDSLRKQLVQNGHLQIPTADELGELAAKRLLPLAQPKIRAVINATGIVLHTNLGRSPLAESAARAAYEAARGYLNLEMDLESGKRSSRQNPIRDGLRKLTGAESGTAVNNCAAATVIVLRALALGKEVIVSRGQLIEIGGSFRIPDIMRVSGASLREVGTTNITRVGDYEQAITANTGLIMRIHSSNYRIRGFTKSVSIDELVQLGKKHGIPVIDDAGSGASFDFSAHGLPGEPSVREGIAAGADLVLFSGDKLLGGPQAGLIAGAARLIKQIESDPLMRAFRLDKMTLAALEATFRLYDQPEKLTDTIPTIRLLTYPLARLKERCERFAKQLESLSGLKSVAVLEDTAFVGGGSLPDQALPTYVIALKAREIDETALAYRLRVGQPAVVGRIHAEQVRLDLRTVFEDQEPDLLNAIANALVPLSR